MTIAHVNLAKGFRGGERQTELLIRELSKLGLKQILIVRQGSVLSTRMTDIPELEIRSIRKPYILGLKAVQGCDLLHVHEAKAGQYAYWARLFLGIPYVITRRVTNRPGSNFFTRTIYRNARKIIALSEAIKTGMLEYDPQLDIGIIPDMSAQLESEPEALSLLRDRFAGRFVIGQIGELIDYKGQEVLLSAARILSGRYPDLQFVFLGRGKDEARLTELVHDLDNICFEGFVDNVGDYLKLFDLFAFPSLQEGLGSTLVDAMQAGLPIVASNTGGIPELIKHEVNGLLVPPGDAESLALAIERLYQAIELRHALSVQARADAEAYMPTQVAARYLQEIYSAILPAT